MPLTQSQQDQLYKDEMNQLYSKYNYEDDEDDDYIDDDYETFSPDDVKKLANSRETDIESAKVVNIESSEKVSDETKKEMQETTEENDKEVQEAKPKSIIKIPKPFGLGYIIIDLSKMLGDLLKGLAAGIVALLLAKIASALSELLQDKLSKGGVSQNDINDAFNNTDINGLIKESKSEYENRKSSNSTIDIDNKSDKVIDVYSHPNKLKKNQNNKYSIDKRNRKDILDSDIVNEREGSKNKNTKLVKNSNYGVYYD